MSCPETKTVPVEGVSNPAIIRSNVVLPQPDGPKRLKNSPEPIDRFSGLTTWLSPKLLLILTASTAGRFNSVISPSCP